MQRVRLSDGKVETILTGMVYCDPVRRTAWGTILVGEELGSRRQCPRDHQPAEHHRRPVQPHERRADRRRCRERRAARRRRSPVLRGHRAVPQRRHVLRRREPPVDGEAGRRVFQVHSHHSLDRRGEDPRPRRFAAGRRHGLRPAPRQAHGNTDYGQGSNTGLGTWIPVPAGEHSRICGAFTSANFSDRLLPSRRHRHRRSCTGGRQRALLRQQHRQRGHRPQLGRDHLRDRRQPRRGDRQHRHTGGPVLRARHLRTSR